MSDVKKIDLVHLLEDFSKFQPDKNFLSMETRPFARAIAEPEPEFITPFIKERMDRGIGRETAIRDLYAFLLDKRYYTKMNLLYFAFDVYCGSNTLSKDVLEITPLPHEDGVPLFKYRLLSDYKIE